MSNNHSNTGNSDSSFIVNLTIKEVQDKFQDWTGQTLSDRLAQAFLEDVEAKMLAQIDELRATAISETIGHLTFNDKKLNEFLDWEDFVKWAIASKRESFGSPNEPYRNPISYCIQDLDPECNAEFNITEIRIRVLPANPFDDSFDYYDGVVDDWMYIFHQCFETSHPKTKDPASKESLMDAIYLANRELKQLGMGLDTLDINI